MSIRNLAAVLILLAVFVGAVIAHYTVLTNPYPGHNDFMTVWQGSKQYFENGLDPYSAEVSLIIQENLYGRAALPDEQPNHYAYPFYTTLVVWPTIHFDYAWATAIWMVFLEACLIVMLVLALNIFRWQPKPLTFVGLVLFSLMWYPAMRGLTLGQISHVIAMLQMLALWCLLRGYPAAGGIALALTTAKPQMVVFFVPFLLLWAWINGHRRFVTWFVGTLAGLVAVSFLLLPSWISGMVDQVTFYPEYIEVSTPAWVVAQYWLGLGDVAEYALNLAGIALMLWAWWIALSGGQDDSHGRFLWAAMITLTVSHLIGLRTATPHFVLFLVPLLFYFQRWAEQGRGLLTTGVLIALFALPWAQFLLTLGDAKFESPFMFLPIPLLTLILLLVTRHQWWMPEKHALPVQEVAA